MAQAAPQHWHKPQGGWHTGQGHGHRGYRDYGGGYGGYPRAPYGPAYGLSPPRPGLVSGGDSVRARVGGTRAAVFASIQQRSSVPPWPLLTPSRSALVKK